MRVVRNWGMLVVGMVLGGSLFALQGCSYVEARSNDAKEMFDVGLTFSKDFQFSAYMNCPVIAPLGYGKVDGYFVGVGGDKTGVQEFHQESKGLLAWGREEVSWGSFDPKDSDKLSIQGVGVLGLAEGRNDDKPYTPACMHYFHLGWVGVVGNIRWLEIGDFFAGILTFDPMDDDIPPAPRAMALRGAP